MMDAGSSRQKQRVILGAAGLAAVLLAYLFVDRPLADWAHGLGKPAWCVALTHLADLPEPVSFIAVVGLGVAWLTGHRNKPIARLVLSLFAAVLLAILAKDLLKFAFGRTWPETWVNHNPSWIAGHVYGLHPFHGGAGWGSFPSGHMTLITAPCAVLWPELRRARPMLALLPALVACGLIGADFHFLSDCIAGVLLGAACAMACRAAIDNARPAGGSR